MTDADLSAYLADANLRADNLRLLLDSVEAQLSEKSEQKQLLTTSAAWLATLRDRVAEVEADTEEAFSKRRELVKLLVESITAGRDEEGKLRVDITYRFGPPTGGPGKENHNEGGQRSDVGAVAHPQGWAHSKPRPDAETFVKGAREIGLDPVVVHAKYLINLASPDPEHRERSIRALAAELVTAGSLGAGFVVVHPGSHGESEEKKGVDRLVEGLIQARELAGDEAAEPVVENSVGARGRSCAPHSTLWPGLHRGPACASAWIRRTLTSRVTISPRRRVLARSRGN